MKTTVELPDELLRALKIRAAREDRTCGSNTWLALVLSTHLHHALARDWFEAVEAPGSVEFCRATQQSLLRLLTNPAELAPYGNPPLTNAEAWAVYAALVGDERIVLMADEPAGLESRWRTFAMRDTASPKRWMDAYLAAFARTGGLRMVTSDGAFEQFEEHDLLVLRS